MPRKKKEPELFEDLYSEMTEPELEHRIVCLMLDRYGVEQDMKDYVDGCKNTINDLNDRIDACIHWVKQKKAEEKSA